MFKPTEKFFHALGEKISKENNLEGICSYQEISDTLGLKGKQWAWHICMVAIGKLAYQVKCNNIKINKGERT